MSVKKKLPISQ